MSSQRTSYHHTNGRSLRHQRPYGEKTHQYAKGKRIDNLRRKQHDRTLGSEQNLNKHLKLCLFSTKPNWRHLSYSYSSNCATTTDERKKLDLQFKEPKSNLKIAIVVDMWNHGIRRAVPRYDVLLQTNCCKQKSLCICIMSVLKYFGNIAIFFHFQ